jgi:hypothetical protein
VESNPDPINVLRSPFRRKSTKLTETPLTEPETRKSECESEEKNKIYVKNVKKTLAGGAGWPCRGVPASACKPPRAPAGSHGYSLQ